MPRRSRPVIRAQVGGGNAELVPDLDHAGGWTLLVDGTPQSHVDIADPTRLEFEYVRWLAHVADALPTVSSVLHLGGGGWTLARYLAAVQPGSRHRVVEVDAALVAFVREHLPVPARSGIRVRVGDARAALESTRSGRYDLVVLDAFDGARVPTHLTTIQCIQRAAEAVGATGAVAFNCADGGSLRFARALTATFAAVLPHVMVIAQPGTLRGRRFGNLVVVGSMLPLPGPAISRRLAGDAFPARLLQADDVAPFVGTTAVIVDGAPMLSPTPPAGWLTHLAR